MIIDVLYFEGCPNHVPARDLVQSVLTELGMTAEVRDVKVTDAADAQSKGFLGSPSVRLDGIDVEPSAAGNERFGMMCRVYRYQDIASGIPPREMIETALQTARMREFGDA